MKKITNTKNISMFLSSFSLFFSAIPAFAVSYVPLEPNAFPGMTNADTSVNLTKYLGLVFNFGIAIAVVLALVMIIWGGITKMTTDSWTAKDEANSKITNALYGLGLALISWVILYTINPCLVQFTATSGGCKTNNVLLVTPPPSQTQTSTNQQVTVSGGLTDSYIRSQFIDSNGNEIITVNKSNCETLTSTNCTSLDGLPKLAVDNLLTIRSLCKSNCINITGGTETGNPEDPTHVSHGQGIATVDISYNPQVLKALQSSYASGGELLTENSTFGTKAMRGVYTCEPAGGGNKSVPCNSSAAAVIHIQF